MSKEGESSDGRMGVWLDMWDNGGMSEFQVNKPHPKIQEHYEFYTSGNPDATLFFPLCGDMHDMVVLGGKGHTIVGVECSETGIKTFFNKNKIEFTEEKCDAVKGKCFKSKDGRYRMYSCDIFDFNKSAEG
ncbi:thiopurine S-methyltransferase-like, partial [Aplysia californica]|uniref:Thiopurine S-methyltransferase-like n=1 Tax=Aplysia californica TaxID=6500 RepID=A0ABM1W1S2_APLCA